MPDAEIESASHNDPGKFETAGIKNYVTFFLNCVTIMNIKDFIFIPDSEKSVYGFYYRIFCDHYFATCNYHADTLVCAPQEECDN